MKTMLAALAGFTILSLSLAQPVLAAERLSLLDWGRLGLVTGLERELLAVPAPESAVRELENWDATLGATYALMLYPSDPSRVLLLLDTRYLQPLDVDSRPSGRIGLKLRLF